MKQPNRILLLKMDHIGDALWSFPAIRTLRTSFPSAEIDMLCTPYLAEAFRRMPDLSHVIEYDAATALNDRRWVLRNLRSQHYDVAIVLGPVDKVNHLAFLSGARERIGYAYSGKLLRALTRRVLLTRSFPHPADVAKKSGLPLPHEVTAMITLVEKYGAAAMANPELFFALTDAEKTFARSLLQRLLPGKPSFAALHLCTKSFQHGWIPSAFASLALQLQQSCPNVSWIVTAGPSEEPHLEPYRTALAAAGIPIVTGLSLAGMAALLTQVQLLVSWDTGVIHLASAVGTPVVDIFPTKDFDYCVQRWRPWNKGSAVLVQKNEQLDSMQITAIISTAMRLLE